MTNIAIPSVSPTLNIPADKLQFLNLGPGVIWTGNDLRTKPTFTPNYGYQGEYEQDGAITDYKNTNIFSPNSTQGLIVNYDGGKTHSANIEFHGANRWMPASVYNGHGFILNNNSSSNNATFLANYSLIFVHKRDELWINYGFKVADAPNLGDKYYSVSSNRASDRDTINEIRGFSSAYILQGFLFNIRTGSGAGSTVSSTKVYNLRIGHKYSDTGSDLRVIPNGKRSFGHRDRNPVTFTNPYE